MPFTVSIDDSGNFRDRDDRVLTLRGINLAADSKLPSSPSTPSHVLDNFFDGDNVSFVGRPFTLDDADVHLARIKSWGFNTIRYVYTWEAIEHAGPGKYDDEFIESTVGLLKKIKTYGFYVFMDPHQDAWSRFSGGSGAPMWTLHAVGLDPKMFVETEGAVVQNTWPDPSTFPRMTWATNYDRLACLTLFTMFWAGRDFAPKCVIDGVNIQDYLQSHFLGSIKRLAQAVYTHPELDDDFILGWESINEPFRGFLGNANLAVYPEYQKLQSYTSPTPFEAMLLGSGRAVEVSVFDFGALGAYKTGTKLVNGKEFSIWLGDDYDDTRYGWTRDTKWELGDCVWALHGVWDSESGELLRPDYFKTAPDGTDLTGEGWADKYFIDHFNTFADMIRGIRPDTMLFCQTPVMAVPPDFLNSVRPRMVFTPHYYDGLTLIRKHWSSIWNVDVVGVLRGKYWSPVFALRFGERAIRNCLRDQLRTLKQEGVSSFGVGVPCLMSEIGIPFDMNDKKAFADGDYSTQIRALDANINALEGSMMHHCFWVYSVGNSHKWGDNWNGEDLSFYSKSDVKHRADLAYSTSSSQLSLISGKSSVGQQQFAQSTDTIGARAVEAFARPTPVKTAGVPQSYSFDITKAVFGMEIYAIDGHATNVPTEIYMPDFHFPDGDVEVQISSGRWDHDRANQVLRWWHDAGKQTIRIVGIRGQQRMQQNSSDSMCICCS
ncbi:glycoside hydrolase superfamily [Lipomyces arxii]|uniref:glycoside hydrolase superfamily n=1 Tax=Lipomyces arxii TaxID=56418 RepID=UPI0034CE3FA6